MKKLIFFFFITVILGIFSGCKSKEEGIKHFNQGLIFYKNGNYDKAIDEFKEACDNGIAEGCYNGGLLLEKNKVNFFTKFYYGPEIYEAYEKGCELGNSLSCIKVKKWEEYKNGSGFDWILWIIIAIIFFFFSGYFGGKKRKNDSEFISSIDPSDLHPHF
jgi:tetratricopeptide (TPR) repeat protein